MVSPRFPYARHSTNEKRVRKAYAREAFCTLLCEESQGILVFVHALDWSMALTKHEQSSPMYEIDKSQASCGFRRRLQKTRLLYPENIVGVYPALGMVSMRFLSCWS